MIHSKSMWNFYLGYNLFNKKVQQEKIDLIKLILLVVFLFEILIKSLIKTIEYIIYIYLDEIKTWPTSVLFSFQVYIYWDYFSKEEEEEEEENTQHIHTII